MNTNTYYTRYGRVSGVLSHPGRSGVWGTETVGPLDPAFISSTSRHSVSTPLSRVRPPDLQ
eukprot:5130851-Prymnesium_polylepis.1